MSISTGSISRQEKTRISAGFSMLLVSRLGFEPRTSCLKDSGEVVDYVRVVQTAHFPEHFRTQLSNVSIFSICC
jgi:hypothetical protein